MCRIRKYIYIYQSIYIYIYQSAIRRVTGAYWPMLICWKCCQLVLLAASLLSAVVSANARATLLRLIVTPNEVFVVVVLLPSVYISMDGQTTNKRVWPPLLRP